MRRHSANLPRALGPVLFLVLVFANFAAAQDKLKAADVIAKHLESIGTAKARDSVKTRIIAGTSQVIFRTEPSGQAIGRAVLASEGAKQLVGMSFPSPVYPREQFGFNGSGFMAAFVTPGVRSVLGSFLMTNDVIFKQGLMSGALSSTWPLLDAGSTSQLEYVGTDRGSRSARAQIPPTRRIGFRDQSLLR